MESRAHIGAVLRHAQRGFLFLIALVGVLVTYDCCAQDIVRSPEGMGSRGAIITTTCSSDAECSLPVLHPQQDPACVESRCVRGGCVEVTLTGKRLDLLGSPGSLACYRAPLVCDAQGMATPSTDHREFVAVRDGEPCVATSVRSNPCERSVCQRAQCIYVANDGASCADPRVVVGQCEKRACKDRVCRAIGDPNKEGASCVDPTMGTSSQTSGCRTTEYQCNAAGACIGETPRIAAGAECASDPNELASAANLPPLFRTLVQESATFPLYACNTSLCKLEFCGDDALNGSEQCDGAHLPTGVPPSVRCSASCTLEACGDGRRDGAEECDGSDVPPTAPPGSRCGPRCLLERCGDGIRNGDEVCDGKDIPSSSPKGSRCSPLCILEFCGDGIRNGSEACDGTDTPGGSSCSPQCILCEESVVKRVDLCRTPQTAPRAFNQQQQIEYWLRELAFLTYKDGVSTNHVHGVLFTYTNEQGQRCRVVHDMYDGAAPGLGVCRDGIYEKFEFLCSTCGGSDTTCTGNCSREHCGDGVLNNGGREQCDGSAFPANTLPGATCTAACQLRGTISLNARGSCTIEPEGNVATSIFCRVGSLESWSEGAYAPKFNAPTLEGRNGLRNLESRALTSASNLCKGIAGPDSGYTGTKQAILTRSDVSLPKLGAPFGTVDFECVQQVP